jgi:hypothetical protein
MSGCRQRKQCPYARIGCKAAASRRTPKKAKNGRCGRSLVRTPGAGVLHPYERNQNPYLATICLVCLSPFIPSFN